MQSVQKLRQIFFWAGWATLAVSAFIVVASLMPISTPEYYMNPQPALMGFASSLISFTFAVIPFFAWGVLTALYVIHDQLEEQLELMRG